MIDRTAAGALRLAPPHPSRGQTLVEFSLALPLLVLLLFALVDGARLAYFASVLSGAARESARLAAVEASWIGWSAPNCNTAGGPVCRLRVTGTSSLEEDVVRAANRMVAGLGTISEVHIRCDKRGNEPDTAWTGISCGENKVGDVVSVRVVFTFRPITPFLGDFLPTITQSGSASMVIQ